MQFWWHSYVGTLGGKKACNTECKHKLHKKYVKSERHQCVQETCVTLPFLLLLLKIHTAASNESQENTYNKPENKCNWKLITKIQNLAGKINAQWAENAILFKHIALATHLFHLDSSLSKCKSLELFSPQQAREESFPNLLRYPKHI